MPPQQPPGTGAVADPKFKIEQDDVREVEMEGGEDIGGGGGSSLQFGNVFTGVISESRSRKLSSIGAGIMRGPTRSARSSFQEQKNRGLGIGVGVQGNGAGYVSTNELKAALAREAQQRESDLQKNLELKVGKL